MNDPAIRFLPEDEYWKIAADYAEADSELPDKNAVVLALEREGEIVGHLAFHRILALGLAKVNPKYQSNGGLAIKLLAHAAEKLFGPGDSLFIPLAEGESSGMIEQMGCRPIGKLFRRDF